MLTGIFGGFRAVNVTGGAEDATPEPPRGDREQRGEDLPQKRMEEDPLPALTRLRVSRGPSRAGNSGMRVSPAGHGLAAGGGCCCVGFGHGSPLAAGLSQPPPLSPGGDSTRTRRGTRGARGQAAAFAYRKAELKNRQGR